MKHLSIGQESRLNLANALEQIALAVGSTLGPGGRPFGFDKLGADMRLSASFTKDGLTVLKSLHFNNPVGDAVLQYCKQASSNSVLASGDGPQPLYSKVLTPKGFVEMKDVVVGMEVCGTDGSIQKVVGVFPKGQKEIYKVTFSDGRVVECCEDHLWTVTDTYSTDPKEVTKTTKQLMEKFKFEKNNGYTSYRYYTPRPIAQFYSNKEEMPLDPYLVGVLLGDGSLSESGAIEICIGLKKEHILSKLKLPEGFFLKTSLVENRNCFRVKINGKNSNGQNFHRIVESIGLLNAKSKTKFIPKSYLYSDLESRKKLLQGLLDIDGYINSRGKFQFSTVSAELALDFKELCRSLGIPIYYQLLKKSEEGGGYSDPPLHCIRELFGYKYGDKIIDISPTGKYTEMQCIKVSNKNSLYITDGYISTHNTTSTIVLANAVAQAILKSKNGKVPQALARQLMAEANKAIEEIRKEAIKNEEAIEHVAMTSANGDKELTKVVLEAIKQSSAFGTLVVEKNPASPIRYKISKQDGYSNCGGYNYNNTLALSASANGEAAASRPLEWNNPLVLLFNGNIHLISQIEPILTTWAKACSSNPKHLVVVCYEVSDEVCNKLLVVNRQMAKHGVAVFVVKPRLTAEINSSLQIMRDLAAFCGISENHIVDGGNFKDLNELFFGTCNKVSIALNHTAFLGRAENHWVDERIRQNQSIVENARSEFDRQITAIRNAELSEGLVKVEIGGGLLPDLQERADRFDDASKAAQSCMRHGALPGCGVSYIRAGKLAGVGEELTNALETIHKTILLNYGVNFLEKKPINILDRLKGLFKPKSFKKVRYEKGYTVRIDEKGITEGKVEDLKVYDACETICAVILNGVSLGCQIAIAGGYSYRPRKEEDDAEMSYGN
jgi:hypothetical protein